MNDRERLGLPDHFVAGRLDRRIEAARCELRRGSVADLLNTLASAEATLAQRLASGNLLARLGDSRITTLQPAMVDVPGGEVGIGLPFADVAAVSDAFAGLGLDRSWIAKECPRHGVTLRPCRIARFPVTNLEYR